MTLVEILQAKTDDLKKRHRKIKNSISHDECVEAVMIEKELQVRQESGAVAK